MAHSVHQLPVPGTSRCEAGVDKTKEPKAALLRGQGSPLRPEEGMGLLRVPQEQQAN